MRFWLDAAAVARFRVSAAARRCRERLLRPARWSCCYCCWRSPGPRYVYSGARRRGSDGMHSNSEGEACGVRLTGRAHMLGCILSSAHRTLSSLCHPTATPNRRRTLARRTRSASTRDATMFRAHALRIRLIRNASMAFGIMVAIPPTASGTSDVFRVARRRRLAGRGIHHRHASIWGVP